MEEDIKKGFDGLERSRDFLRSIIDSISDPLLVISLNHNILFANRAARRIFDVDDPVGMHLSCYQVIHCLNRSCEEALKGKYPCALKYVVSTKEPIRFVHNYIDKSHNDHFMEVSAWPVFNDRGDVAQAVHLFRDITKIRLGEERREKLILDFQRVLSKVGLKRSITGRSLEVLPVCMSCKKIRDDNGDWKGMDAYIKDHWRAEFTHGVCKECEEKMYDADKDE